ncbi:MAG: DUF4445 domain-containing protein [Clostridia bacterium]|nr:DUF4445 domain-containing protein [Clostridia bacterium]
MPEVKIDNKIYIAEKGEILKDVLIKAEKTVPHICGGMGACKKCLVSVDGKKELSCQYKIINDISVEISEAESITSETGIKEKGNLTENLCFCLDIGTTTLALALVSLDEKKIIEVKTATNPQRSFGADVMSRITYCQKNGVKELQEALIKEINKILASFEIKETENLFVAGNTTMLHLFFGVDCSSLGVAPYTPVFLNSRVENADDLKIKGVKKIISLPSISAFVGADLVAGLNFAGKPEKEKYNLLLDLGTNAEIVLFSENSVYCTSAAAGPCFEGANISAGMSAVSGAIYSYSDNSIKVIGNTLPKGICGTGLIDIIASLLENKTIDETGFMEAEEIEIANGVFIEQNDIRQYQLAKSAVYSGIVALLKEKNIEIESIEKFYVSGGFSSKINIENAVKTGLFPKELKEKCVAINNSSLLGTVKYACEKNNLSGYLENSEYIDLSQSEAFSNEFLKNMNFIW